MKGSRTTVRVQIVWNAMREATLDCMLLQKSRDRRVEAGHVASGIAEPTHCTTKGSMDRTCSRLANPL